MTLEECVKGLHDDVDRFESDYRKGLKEKPGEYVDNLEPGEWGEVFMAFLETEEPND